METIEIVGFILYVAFIIQVTFFGKITIGKRRVENILERLIIGMVSFPLIGLIFWCLGLLAKIILAPFVNIF